MASDNGGNSADGRESWKQSLNRGYPGKPNSDASTLLGSSDITLDDAIGMHLIDCDQCRKVAETARPVPMGQKSKHCNTYWAMQLLRAQYEGAANNIVAYTEYGDEARKGRPLE